MASLLEGNPEKARPQNSASTMHPITSKSLFSLVACCATLVLASTPTYAATTESASVPVAAAPNSAPVTVVQNPLLQGLNPSDIPVRVEDLLNEGKNAQALAIADAGLTQNANNLKLRFMRTVALERLERVDEAISELRRMTADFPEVPEPYNNLAVILAKRGALDEAEALLKKVLSISPNFAVARKNLGDVYLTKALDNFEAAAGGIHQNPEFTERLETLSRWFGRTVKTTASTPDVGAQSTTQAAKPQATSSEERSFATEYDNDSRK